MITANINLAPNGALLSCYLFEQTPSMHNCDIRPAVLILPGGGFNHTSDRESEPVAFAYLAAGFNVFLLRYSTAPEDTWDMAYADAQAALDYIRKNAEGLHIDPEKVAVVGFSAGGHLAAALGTRHEHRPNALILGYPVILESMSSRVSKPVVSLDVEVDANTPPAFLFATSNDETVPVTNALSFAQALAAHEIFFEMHVYLFGKHGFSLANPSVSDGIARYTIPDAQSWHSDSVRFLHHLFGDFALEGVDTGSDLPSFHTVKKA